MPADNNFINGFRLLAVLTLFHFAVSNTISIEITPSDLEINKNASYTFDFNRNINPLTFAFISNPPVVPLNSYIEILFPTQFTSLASTSTLPCINYVTGFSLTCSVNNANKKITISDYFRDSTTTSNTRIIIDIIGISNPIKSGITYNF
jgi:hypothetical protein